MPIRLVLADDHLLVRAGLEQLLISDGGFEVLARCESGEQALDAVREHRPDVLIVDLNMPGMDGLAVASAVRAEHRSVRVILLTASFERGETPDPARLGVDDIVLKDEAPSTLTGTIRRVCDAPPVGRRASR